MFAVAPARTPVCVPHQETSQNNVKMHSSYENIANVTQDVSKPGALRNSSFSALHCLLVSLFCNRGAVDFDVQYNIRATSHNSILRPQNTLHADYYQWVLRSAFTFVLIVALRTPTIPERVRRSMKLVAHSRLSITHCSTIMTMVMIA